MKGSRYISKDAKCPFYICEDPQRIMCEGVEEETGVHLTFRSCNHKKLYARSFCADEYEECRIHKMLKEKYE